MYPSTKRQILLPTLRTSEYNTFIVAKILLIIQSKYIIIFQRGWCIHLTFHGMWKRPF